MFKNKYFIMGIGVGMIIGVLLLQLIVTGQQWTPQLTKEQLQREAEQLGYTLVPEQTEEGDASSNSVAVSTPPNVPLTDKDTLKSDQSTDPSSTTASSSESTEASKTDGNQSEFVTIQIKSSTPSKRIAEQLEEAGVIEDALKFDKYVISLQQQRKLRAGKFKFEIPSTHEQVLQVLQSDPNG